ncbi:MAG TPA: nucleotide exchange factor GrpE [Ignavibacteriaceae bacterium]|nr:nucleotide exchange factor GrpE [Ignavibacteriaceae bacterium]
MQDKKSKNKSQEEFNSDDMAQDSIEKEESKMASAEGAESKNESEELIKKINELESKVSELQDLLLRKAAEFENYKRRTEIDQMNLLSYAAESFIIKLLPVVDDFERSLKHINDAKDTGSIKDGIKFMFDKLLKILNDQGVKKMEVLGKPFNVGYHDALMQRIDNSVPPHTVIEEIDPGYLYKDKVIRHAKVIVSDESTMESSEIKDEDRNNTEEGN